MSEVDEAEVERLIDAWVFQKPGQVSIESGIRAVLVDLSSRWHLVPREGEERTEVDGPCEVCKGTGELFDDKGWSPNFPEHRPSYGDGIYDCGFCEGTGGTKPARVRTVRAIPDGNGGTWVHTSAWQVVEEAKP